MAERISVWFAVRKTIRLSKKSERYLVKGQI